MASRFGSQAVLLPTLEQDYIHENEIHKITHDTCCEVLRLQEFLPAASEFSNYLQHFYN